MIRLFMSVCPWLILSKKNSFFKEIKVNSQGCRNPKFLTVIYCDAVISNGAI
jgi:hypothetical protein